MWRFQRIRFLISFTLDFPSRIIRRENPKNRIQSIKRFLDDYESLEPNLKNLVSWSYDYYQKELQKEYLKVSRHPYPDEYLDLEVSGHLDPNDFEMNQESHS